MMGGEKGRLKLVSGYLASIAANPHQLAMR